MNPPWLDPDNLTRQAQDARDAYLNTLDPDLHRAEWHDVVDRVTAEFATEVRSALQSDEKLAHRLEQSGGIMALLRQLTAPPLSQDQFRLICPAWPKSSEKEAKPLKPHIARQVAAAPGPSHVDFFMLDGALVRG